VEFQDESYLTLAGGLAVRLQVFEIACLYHFINTDQDKSMGGFDENLNLLTVSAGICF